MIITFIVILKNDPSAFSLGGPAFVTYPKEKKPGNFSNRYRPILKLANRPKSAPISIVRKLINKPEN